MFPPLFSLNNLVDVPSTRTDPQEMYPLLFSVKPKYMYPLLVPQRMYPPMCYDKVLRRLNIWNILNGDTKEFSGGKSFEIFCIWEREESKEFSDCVVLNSLTREKGDTKEFRRLVLCSFGKGRRKTQKEFRQLVLGEFFLAKGEGNEKYE